MNGQFLEIWFLSMFLYFIFVCLQRSFALVFFVEGTQKLLICCPIGQKMLK